MEQGSGFEWALEMMKAGGKVHREGWNGKGMWIEVEFPFPPILSPYIVMHTADNKIVPWVASQTDLLANDWLEKEKP